MSTTTTNDAAHRAATYEAEAARWEAAGRPDAAAQFYAATLDHRPGDTRVRMMLAQCLVRSSQPAAAAGEYLRVALSYAAQRRHVEAMALFHQVLHLDPSQFVYVAVADVLRAIGRQARPLCARAAEAHLQVGRLGDGLHMLRLGAEIDERNPEVRRRLAQIYLGQHMTREAVTNLVEAGRLLLAAGNNAEYVEVAELLLRHDPRHLETLRELPRVYLRVGEPQRAVVKLSDLMRVSPGDTLGYEILAHAFAVIGRVPTALSVLERLVGELCATGRAAQADLIVERARGWRLDDPEFERSVLALRTPKAAPKPTRARAPRTTTAEDTVVLSIADLVEAESDAVLDLSEDVVEIADAEGTVVLRVQDLSHVGPVPRRRPVGPPPLPRRPAAGRTPARAPRAQTPVRAATRSRASVREPERPLEEATLTLDLADLEAELELELEDITLVRPKRMGDVASLVLDEDSAELREGSAASRRARLAAAI